MLERFVIGVLATAAAATLQPVAASAQLPALPQSPQVINIIDVGGALALTQKAIEAYRKAHPELVSKFTFTKAPAPELAGKIKAQQNAGRVDIDMVLSGTDGISAGVEQHEWTAILPQYAAKFPRLEENYLPPVIRST